MTPIVHIVNMGTAATESHANITVCFMIHKWPYNFFGCTKSVVFSFRIAITFFYIALSSTVVT